MPEPWRGAYKISDTTLFAVYEHQADEFSNVQQSINSHVIQSQFKRAILVTAGSSLHTIYLRHSMSILAYHTTAISTIPFNNNCSTGSSFAKVPETTFPGNNSGFLTDEEIDLRRDTLNFRRAYDGKVAIMNKKTNQFYDVKLDLQSPGTVLLRDDEGQVYYIKFSGLQQV